MLCEFFLWRREKKKIQLATDDFFFFFFVFFFFFHFFPLIVPYSVNLPIRPFWNNKNKYEIFFLCFSALPEINPIYDIRICNCVHIIFLLYFFVHCSSPIFFNVVYLFYTYIYVYLCFCGWDEVLTLRHIKYDRGCLCIYLLLKPNG
jgi:hypothetical protein